MEGGVEGTMRTIKGPGIFLAQFAGDAAPFNSLKSIAAWAAALGYKGVQIPCWDARLFDLKRAAESKSYCEEVRETVAGCGLEITELSTHLQGQLVAVHPAYDLAFDGFAPEKLRGNPKARQAWAVEQLMMAAKASADLGLAVHVTVSGGLGKDAGWNLVYDSSDFVLQELDYLEFIDVYHERIKMFHVKDAEFRPSGRQGVYGGYQSWVNRAGRFRSPGDGQVDFGAIFSKLTQDDFPGWAVLEWECCIKSSEQGAAEGAPCIERHIIEPP